MQAENNYPRGYKLELYARALFSLEVVPKSRNQLDSIISWFQSWVSWLRESWDYWKSVKSHDYKTWDFSNLMILIMRFGRIMKFSWLWTSLEYLDRFVDSPRLFTQSGSTISREYCLMKCMVFQLSLAAFELNKICRKITKISEYSSYIGQCSLTL